MASPVRQDDREGQVQVWSASKNPGKGGVGSQPKPSPAKAKQSQRRYRSLFHQAAKEYWAWREGEDDSQRALGSAFHLLDRLQMLELDQEGKVSLGGLEDLPCCRELLIRKHTMELERMMRLWRALVQQMKGQVARVEELLAEAWYLYRSDPFARARQLLQRRPPSSPSPSLPPTPSTASQLRESPSLWQDGVVGTRSPSLTAGQASAAAVQQRPSHDVGAGEVDAGGRVGGGCAPTIQESLVAMASSHRLDSVREHASVSVGGSEECRPVVAAVSATPPALNTAAATAETSGDGGGLASKMAVGPAEYLQWLGDMSNMLLHEQWRKEELLARVAFGNEAEAAAGRAYVQAFWSSRSAASFLDQSAISTAVASSQLVPPSRPR